MSRNIYLISVDTLKKRSAVHSNVDDKLLLPEIKTAQDIFIEPALGSSLYKRLQEGIAANNLTTDERTLLDDYITDALVNYVAAAMPVASSYQFFTKGMLQATVENTQTATIPDMLRVSEKYKKQGDHYRERAIRYICTNRSSFPQYRAADEDLRAKGSGYSMQCWLPDDC